MSGEIEVSETPNWLQELEAKRERRLKARLGHETGAGAPCLKCGDKCPGLDLHFWRKSCKICKCSKEEHEVQDDDIYGWAQFQLLGSKPNKIKRKIVLPGKKDAVELDWEPKGHKDTVDKYLKTLPPEQLPVKGSQAAQDRKQLLQKQIPIHDIDPTLCHDLTEDELKQMNDYVTYVKQASVGIGQIVSLSSLIKGNLHTLNPSEAAIIASRYAKGVPLSEIVKLQSQSRASLLKSQGLSQNLEKLNINDPHVKTLPTYTPSSVSTTEESRNPLVTNKVHDVNYPGYTRDINQTLPSAQFSSGLKPEPYKGFVGGSLSDQNRPTFDTNINEKYLQNPNFDPKSIPSHFITQGAPYGQAYTGINDQPNMPYDENLMVYKSGDDSGQINSAFVPYSKVSSGLRPEENYVEENPLTGISYSTGLPGHAENSSTGLKHGGIPGQNVPGGYKLGHNMENVIPQQPNYSKTLAKETESAIRRNTFDDQFTSTNKPASGSPGYKSGHTVEQSFNPLFSKVIPGDSTNAYENVGQLKNRNNQNLPNYAPGKYTVQSETQSPTRLPQNVRDLAFSTYDQNTVDPNELEYNPDPKYHQSLPSYISGEQVLTYDNYPTRLRPEDIVAAGKHGLGDKVHGNNTSSGGAQSGQYRGPDDEFRTVNAGAADNKYPYGNSTPHNLSPNKTVVGPYGSPGGNYSTGIRPSARGTTNKNYPGDGTFNPTGSEGSVYDPNIPTDQLYENYPSRLRPGDNTVISNSYPGGNISGQQFGHNITGNKSAKKLSELHPGKLNINEDFLQPSQVTIGAIQDINYPEIKAAIQGTNDFYEDYSPDSLREILNNIILPDCHYCKKPFEENEFAITIDRANVLFHAECFKCAGCNQILADNVYFYNKETDNVYCGRDYAKIRGFPRCKACDELIFTKEYCLAENCTFHLKHFCCMECDKPLAGQDYILEEEIAYCLPCFEQNKASKCSSCCRVIKPDEMGCNLNGIHFHANDECFACKMCKKPLMGKKLLLRNEKLYCSHDCFGADK